MRKFQYTEEFRESLITLLKEGKTNEEIGKLYGINKKTVTKWIRRIGISSKESRRRRSPFHPGDENKIIEMYKQGKTTKEIARSFSTSVATLEEFQREHDIKAQDYFEYRFSYNVNVFNRIDTEEKAYWLGFLYADGCVDSNRNRITLELKDIDLNHILKFKSFLGDTRDDSVIKTVTIKLPSGNITSHSRYCVSSKTLRDDLIKLGCFPKKSLKLVFPDISLFDKESLVFDFIRGYIDGDGCLHKTETSVKIEILGTENFLRGIIKYLPEFKKVGGISHSKAFRTWCCGKSAKKVANKLYGHATIYLDRKFEKFNSLFRYNDDEINNMETK